MKRQTGKFSKGKGGKASKAGKSGKVAGAAKATQAAKANQNVTATANVAPVATASDAVRPHLIILATESGGWWGRGLIMITILFPVCFCLFDGQFSAPLSSFSS